MYLLAWILFALLGTCYSSWYSGISSTYDYNRCKATHRCFNGRTSLNFTTSDVEYSSFLFPNGVKYYADLSADFEQWEMGTFPFVSTKNEYELSGNSTIDSSLWNITQYFSIYPDSLFLDHACNVSIDTDLLKLSISCTPIPVVVGPNTSYLMDYYLCNSPNSPSLNDTVVTNLYDLLQSQVIQSKLGNLSWPVVTFGSEQAIQFYPGLYRPTPQPSFSALASAYTSNVSIALPFGLQPLLYQSLNYSINSIRRITTTNGSLPLQVFSLALPYDMAPLLTSIQGSLIPQQVLSSKEVAVFAFQSIFLGSDVKVTLRGSRPLLLYSSSSIFINTPIVVPPGTLSGFQGASTIHSIPSNSSFNLNSNNEGPECPLTMDYLFTIEAQSTRIPFVYSLDFNVDDGSSLGGTFRIAIVDSITGAQVLQQSDAISAISEPSVIQSTIQTTLFSVLLTNPCDSYDNLQIVVALRSNSTLEGNHSYVLYFYPGPSQPMPTLSVLSTNLTGTGARATLKLTSSGESLGGTTEIAWRSLSNSSQNVSLSYSSSSSGYACTSMPQLSDLVASTSLREGFRNVGAVRVTVSHFVKTSRSTTSASGGLSDYIDFLYQFITITSDITTNDRNIGTISDVLSIRSRKNITGSNPSISIYLGHDSVFATNGYEKNIYNTYQVDSTLSLTPLQSTSPIFTANSTSSSFFYNSTSSLPTSLWFFSACYSDGSYGSLPRTVSSNRGFLTGGSGGPLGALSLSSLLQGSLLTQLFPSNKSTSMSVYGFSENLDQTTVAQLNSTSYSSYVNLAVGGSGGGALALIAQISISLGPFSSISVSGSNGGSCLSSGCSVGAGGGNGGSLLLASLARSSSTSIFIDPNASLTATGGNGGDASFPGVGGSGGVVEFMSSSLPFFGTVAVPETAVVNGMKIVKKTVGASVNTAAGNQGALVGSSSCAYSNVVSSSLSAYGLRACANQNSDFDGVFSIVAQVGSIYLVTDSNVFSNSNISIADVQVNEQVIVNRVSQYEGNKYIHRLGAEQSFGFLQLVGSSNNASNSIEVNLPFHGEMLSSVDFNSELIMHWNASNVDYVHAYERMLMQIQLINTTSYFNCKLPLINVTLTLLRSTLFQNISSTNNSSITLPSLPSLQLFQPCSNFTLSTLSNRGRFNPRLSSLLNSSMALYAQGSAIPSMLIPRPGRVSMYLRVPLNAPYPYPGLKLLFVDDTEMSDGVLSIFNDTSSTNRFLAQPCSSYGITIPIELNSTSNHLSSDTNRRCLQAISSVSPFFRLSLSSENEWMYESIALDGTSTPSLVATRTARQIIANQDVSSDPSTLFESDLYRSLSRGPLRNEWLKLDVFLQYKENTGLDTNTLDVFMNDVLVVSQAPVFNTGLTRIAFQLSQPLSIQSGINIVDLDELNVGPDFTMNWRCPQTIKEVIKSDSDVSNFQDPLVGSLPSELPSWSYGTQSVDGRSALYDLLHSGLSNVPTDDVGVLNPELPRDGKSTNSANQPSIQYASISSHESHLSRRELYTTNTAHLVRGDGIPYIVYINDVPNQNSSSLNGDFLTQGTLLEKEDSWVYFSSHFPSSAWAIDGTQDSSYNVTYVPTEFLYGGVCACSTYDFETWQMNGVQLFYTNISVQESPGENYYLQKPKVVFNSFTNSYKMWGSVLSMQNQDVQFTGVALFNSSSLCNNRDTFLLNEDSYRYLSFDEFFGPFTYLQSFYMDSNETIDLSVLAYNQSNPPKLTFENMNDLSQIHSSSIFFCNIQVSNYRVCNSNINQLFQSPIAFLLRSFIATIDYSFPSSIMLPMWESVQLFDNSSNPENPNFALSYQRAMYAEEYDNPDDTATIKYIREDIPWRIQYGNWLETWNSTSGMFILTFVNTTSTSVTNSTSSSSSNSSSNNRIPTLPGSGWAQGKVGTPLSTIASVDASLLASASYDNSTSTYSLQYFPVDRGTFISQLLNNKVDVYVFGRGRPAVSSKYLDPLDPVNSQWIPNSVPIENNNLTWLDHYRMKIIVDNPVHPTLPDVLAGESDLVFSRTSGYLSVTLLTYDFANIVKSISSINISTHFVFEANIVGYDPHSTIDAFFNKDVLSFLGLSSIDIQNIYRFFNASSSTIPVNIRDDDVFVTVVKGQDTNFSVFTSTIDYMEMFQQTSSVSQTPNCLDLHSIAVLKFRECRIILLWYTSYVTVGYSTAMDTSKYEACLHTHQTMLQDYANCVNGDSAYTSLSDSSSLFNVTFYESLGLVSCFLSNGTVIPCANIDPSSLSEIQDTLIGYALRDKIQTGL
jgi:hypothetical protein